MRKWNLFGLAAAITLSSMVTATGLSCEANAQEMTPAQTQETQETQEQETQVESHETQVQEAETQLQESTVQETEVEVQETEAQQTEAQETETQPQETTEIIENVEAWETTKVLTKVYQGPFSQGNFDALEQLKSEQVQTYSDILSVDNFTDAILYMRQELVDRRNYVAFDLFLPQELPEEDLEDYMDAVPAAAMAETGISNQGAALIGDLNEYECELSYGWNGEAYEYLFEYSILYNSSEAQEAELVTAIGLETQKLCSGANSDYEKIKNIYDYICGNVRYDYEHLNDETYRLQYSAYAAMIQHTAVCQGYATLFYRMCTYAGVPVRYITGTGNGGGHAWNIVELDGLWYNVDSTWDAYDDPSERNYQYFLKSNADFGDHAEDDSWWNPNGAECPRAQTSYQVPQEDTHYTGLKYSAEDGIWYYLKDGVVDESFYGLVEYNGAKYFVQNGKVNWDYTGLILDNGTWRFVYGGCLNESYTGLTQYYGTWYYVENGTLNWGYTGLANYNGSWYAIENGRLNWNYNGLMLYRGTWYYIASGCLDWNYTGLTQYYGTWYYVYKGALDWGYSGLIYYNSAWYYVESGVMNWGYTGLTLYKGCWYYVEGSIIRWNYTGLVEYYGKRYYVEKSAINWNYNGPFVQDGVEYQVRYGTVVD